MNKWETVLELLKQPSTIKGLIGLAGLFGWAISEMQFNTFIAGIAAIYFIIAIIWQKS